MIIKHYIVTYKNEDLLKRGLDVINTQPIPEGVDYQVHVINNYGHLKPMPDNNFVGLNNVLRLDASTGHLARNWNQAIMLGFEDLNSPKSDIVILSQGDCVFQEGYLSKIIKAHEKYDFVQQGRGDEYHSYTADHIKKVGIWDERFCGIGYQELDYFYRSYIFNPDKIYINHNFHGLEDISNNSLEIVDISHETGYEREDQSHMKSFGTAHQYCLDLFMRKYGIEGKLTTGVDCYKVYDSLKGNKVYPQIETNLLYPYFEKGINLDTLVKLKYKNVSNNKGKVNKTGIVIQGAIADYGILKKNIDLVRKYFPEEDIVISTWKSKSFTDKQKQSFFCDEDDNLYGIKTVRSDEKVFSKWKPGLEVVNGGNIIYQCHTTHAGVNYFRQKGGYSHIIKIRTDECYDSLNIFEKKMRQADDKILCLSLFFRKDFPYHIGDHLLGGRIENVEQLFLNILNYSHSIMAGEKGELFESEVVENKWSKRIWTNRESEFTKLINLTHSDIPPEVKLCTEYISLKEKRDIKASEHVELTKKYFDTFDVRMLRRFYFSANSICGGVSISDKNIEEDGNIFIPDASCEPHADWILCSICFGRALLDELIKSELRSMDDLKLLESDFEKYCSVWKPSLVNEKTKDKTKIQNYILRDR